MSTVFSVTWDVFAFFGILCASSLAGAGLLALLAGRANRKFYRREARARLAQDAARDGEPLNENERRIWDAVVSGDIHDHHEEGDTL